MGEVKHILIATDGSALSNRAAAHAGALARALEARVTIVVVHDEQAVIPEVWSTMGLQLGQGEPSTQAIRQRIEDEARLNTLAAAADAASTLAADPQLINLWGHPADQICDYATEHAADMIVMGSHGRSGIRQALLGSVSHSVANRAPCAVTIVR